MKFQEGDKIVVLATGEKGEVVEWINKKMLTIDVDGIRFPVYADQIDFPYYGDFTAPKTVKPKTKTFNAPPPTEKKIQKQVERDGVWLSFFPVLDKDVFDDDIIDHYRIFLMNHTDDDLTFDFSLYYGSNKDLDLKHTIRALEDMYLFNLPFENLNDQPRIDFDFTLVKTDKKRANHFEVSFKPRPKQIFKLSDEVLKEQKASFKLSLFDAYPAKPEDPDEVDMGKLTAAGFKVYQSEKVRKSFPPVRTLIDLHADKLSGNWQQLTPLQILDMQIKAFEKFYDDALFNRLAELVVIHGVGTGKLKDEIHELLRHKSNVKTFINRLHPLYGYGATEILLNFDKP
jgi:hypothetical protein